MKLALMLMLSLLCAAEGYTAPLSPRRIFLKKAIQSASIGAGLALPSGAFALQPEGYTIPDSEVVDGQQATGNRLDLNSAYVTDYKQFRGLYPTVAGKIASNGPYVSTGDVKKMAKLTEKEMKIFKQYEKEFVVLPPGRQFLERVNARQST